MKNVRPSIVTEEQYQIANKKRMKTQNNKQNQKDRLMFLYNSFNQKLCYIILVFSILKLSVITASPVFNGVFIFLQASFNSI